MLKECLEVDEVGEVGEFDNFGNGESSHYTSAPEVYQKPHDELPDVDDWVERMVSALPPQGS